VLFLKKGEVMADTKEKVEEKVEEKKKGFNSKIFIIGLPLFIVQLVIVYFVTANFLVKPSNAGLGQEVTEAHQEKGDEEAASEEDDEGSFIYTIDDLIVNPAKTSGKRLLLLSVGFGVSSEEAKKKLEERDVVLRDMIISSLSRKTLFELSGPDRKDSLKVELRNHLKSIVPKVKVKNVYFSKYVIN